MTRMDLHPRRPSRAAALLAAAIVSFLAVILPATPASAHAVLQRSTPQSNSIVPAPPVEVVLTFSESVSVVPGKVRVIGPDGTPANRGEPIADGPNVSIPMRTDGPRGTYLVNYRIVSADSHPVAGGFTYSVGAVSNTPVATDGGTQTDPFVGGAIPVFKYLGYAGLLLIVGPALVLALLWPHRLSRRGPTRLAWLGLGLTALSTVGGLILQAPYTTGTSLAGMRLGDLQDVLGTTFGAAYIVRLGVIVAAAILLRPLLAGRAGTVDKALLAFLAVVGLATWPIAGHSGASPVPPVTVLADAAHLGGMAVWLGGLVMLVGFLLRQASGDELEAILPVWSRWAMISVGTLGLAGVVQALIEVGTPHALVSTGYGWLIVAKVGLLAAILGVAAFSRRLVRDRVAPAEPRRLRRLVGIEVATAAVVLAVASALVQTTPARTAEENASQASAQPFSTMLVNDLYSLQFDVDPAKAGDNSMHLYAYDKNGQQLAVVEWRVTAALPSAGIEPIQVPLLKINDNHTIGEITLPNAGSWEFRFTLRISEIDQATVSTTVPIK